jgi:hypothetical protein
MKEVSIGVFLAPILTKTKRNERVKRRREDG